MAMTNNFTLKPKTDDSGYLLSREGEPEGKEFTTFRGALQYARMTYGGEQAQIVLYDRRGCPSISFPTSLILPPPFASA